MSAPPNNDAPPPYPGTGKGDEAQSQVPPGYSDSQPPAFTYGTGYTTQQPQPLGYQQGGYPSIQPIGTQPVGNTTTVIVTAAFRDGPAHTQCPNCHNHVTTNVVREPGGLAWLLCIVMFLLGWWICCFIPFCVDGLQDADHFCPVCKYRIAHYSQM